MQAFTQDGAGIDEALVGSVYQQDALPPASPWLGSEVPGTPHVEATEGGLRWTPRRREGTVLVRGLAALWPEVDDAGFAGGCRASYGRADFDSGGG